jgi:hypothetical protein
MGYSHGCAFGSDVTGDLSTHYRLPRLAVIVVLGFKSLVGRQQSRAQFSSPSHPRRAIHFKISSTGVIVAAKAITSSQSSSRMLKVPSSN